VLCACGSDHNLVETEKAVCEKSNEGEEKKIICFAFELTQKSVQSKINKGALIVLNTMEPLRKERGH
jgi:hypothetical protein